MNPVLVTGASGFIGGHLVRSLARLGIDTVSVFHTARCVEDRSRSCARWRGGCSLRGGGGVSP